MYIFWMQSVVFQTIQGVNKLYTGYHEMYTPEEQDPSCPAHLIVSHNFSELFPDIPYAFEYGVASLDAA